MMILVENDKYVNPDNVGYIETAMGSGSKAIIQGKEVTFTVSSKTLAQLLNKEIGHVKNSQRGSRIP
jgi:hypothetical protein